MPVERVPETVRRAVLLCPGLAVAGVAGPGDALASGHAVEALRLVRKRFPDLLTCLSTNGLMLPEMARTLSEAGIGFVTVTVNAVDPDILAALCAGVVLGGRLVAGREAAAALIERQERGIRLAVRLGIKVKINTVVAPGINDSHTGEVARNAASWGAGRINLIPLIPGHGMAAGRAPSGAEMSVAKEAASQWLELSERCGRCRADACGIPGGKDVSGWLYGAGPGPAAFSHG
jgi:nitrogen fixation protein NifB